jgi:hypothetical protein
MNITLSVYQATSYRSCLKRAQAANRSASCPLVSPAKEWAALAAGRMHQVSAYTSVLAFPIASICGVGSLAPARNLIRGITLSPMSAAYQEGRVIPIGNCNLYLAMVESLLFRAGRGPDDQSKVRRLADILSAFLGAPTVAVQGILVGLGLVVGGIYGGIAASLIVLFRRKKYISGMDFEMASKSLVLWERKSAPRAIRLSSPISAPEFRLAGNLRACGDIVPSSALFERWWNVRQRFAPLKKNPRYADIVQRIMLPAERRWACHQARDLVWSLQSFASQVATARALDSHSDEILGVLRDILGRIVGPFANRHEALLNIKHRMREAHPDKYSGLFSDIPAQNVAMKEAAKVLFQIMGECRTVLTQDPQFGDRLCDEPKEKPINPFWRMALAHGVFGEVLAPVA